MNARTCSSCGSALPDGVSEKQCPACLLKAGMEEQTAPSGAADIPDSMNGGTRSGTPLDPATQAPREAIGTMIGRYKLLQEIGEGGFGIVYLAEQTEPVKRKVALKVLKPGMDTREVVARFKAERQALALMDHTHIARVFDGGATDSGRPYFVMELVKGIPLTKYCDDRRLNTRQRLLLFLDVVSAIQHAHQKGIIHRDLKPSNILVRGRLRSPAPAGAERGGGSPQALAAAKAKRHRNRAIVKVIDFGIAKALGPDLAEKTLSTGRDRLIGTPQYMSPEQAGTNRLDVDTRSDIYSLGLVLYELLTGRTPLDGRKLCSAGIAEMQRLISEIEPLKPSTVPATLADDERSAVGQQRGTEGGKLSGLLRGDLDWIVMKSLEKDRTRRYQTANGFALDIRRYLDDEPVLASPPSVTYRFLKFSRRHRAGVVWTAVISVVVLTAAIGMTILYLQAVEAERLALNRTWDARSAEANALLSGTRPGRRFLALAALKEAASIADAMAVPGNPAKLRNAAIACLAIVDMRPVDSWNGNPGLGSIVAANRDFSAWACSYADGRIEVHSYPEKQLLTEFQGSGEGIYRILRFNAEGDMLAAGYGDASGATWHLKLWDLRSGKGVPGGPGVNWAFDFFPDGQHCAVARRGEAGTSLELVSTRSGEVEKQLPLPGLPHSIAISRDAKLIAVSLPDAGPEPGQGLVQVLGATNGNVIATLEVPQCDALAWSGFENALAVCSGDHTVRVWHGERWTAPPVRLAGHTNTVDAVAWSSDGRLLATSGWDDMFGLWDPFQGTLLSWSRGRSRELQFSRDGKRLGPLWEAEKLTMMEVVDGAVCYRGQGHAGDLIASEGVWNRTGTLMATSGSDGVRLWNREGRQLTHLKLTEGRGLAFSEDSLFTASATGVLKWPLHAKQEADGLVAELHSPKPVGDFRICEQMALSPDGSMLAIIGREIPNAGPSVWLIDLRRPDPPRRLDSPPAVNFCAISRDGQWLAAGTWKGHGVRIWKLPAASDATDLPVHGAATVAFSPDDRWLVTGDTANYRFWKLGSWELEREVPSGMGELFGRMAFSPRVPVIAFARNRDEVKVLHLKTLDELAAPDFDREAPLCFDPTGRLLVTFSHTGIFFWKLDAVRAGLVDLGLDWKELPAFPTLSLPVVRRVVLHSPER